ncbi:MAG: type II CRISPR-associated endonuclease Cas1 [Candidatus Nanopelagicales bacterium]
MSQWRVADLIEYTGELKSARGRLLAGENEIPLEELSCVLIGHKASIGAGVMHHVAKHNVTLITCDWRGVPLAACTGWSENSRVGARHQAQSNLTAPRRKNAWMRVVKAKIRGQASNLDNKNPVVARRLRELALSTRSGDPENKEAQAARMYWTRMFDHPGFTRAPSGSDGANVLLNYGYGILRGQVVRAIIGAGLISALGIHHSNRSNAFALADDLIEPFRPSVDWVVRQLPEDAWLTDPGVKASIVGVLEHPLNSGSQSIQTEITRLAQHFGQYVEGEIETLPVSPWDIAANG